MGRESCIYPNCMMGGGSCDSANRGECDSIDGSDYMRTKPPSPPSPPEAQTEAKYPVEVLGTAMKNGAEIERTHWEAEITRLRAQLEEANKIMGEQANQIALLNDDKKMAKMLEHAQLDAHFAEEDRDRARAHLASVEKEREELRKQRDACADAANQQCFELRLTESARDAAKQVMKEVAKERDAARAEALRYREALEECCEYGHEIDCSHQENPREWDCDCRLAVARATLQGVAASDNGEGEKDVR